MSRLIRIGISLAAVLAAYWGYARVAVPLIEPSATSDGSGQRSEAELKAWGLGTTERWQRELRGLFPPGSWELEDPIILESDQVKVLLRGYERSPDKKEVTIVPCTIIFTPDGPASTAQKRRRQSLILRAPDGALLVFKQPIELSEGTLGRLDRASLIGRITIRGAGKSPGPEDDLEVTARDVELNEERISTPNAVHFSWGANFGDGSEMVIKLRRRREDGAGEGRTPQIDGIELVEIRHLERLHLEPGSEEIVPGSGPKTPQKPSSETSPWKADLPIEVTCRGPFRFDPGRQVATFEDRVNVLRIHPNGPSDQINCAALSVFFARPRGAVVREADGPSDDRAAQTPESWQLRPRRIEASGHDVIVRAPSQQIDVRGQWLEYDFHSGRILLDSADVGFPNKRDPALADIHREFTQEGSREVFLKKGDSEIHARSVLYQPGGTGHIGWIAAPGPGWLRGKLGQKVPGPVYARWNGRLNLRPYEGQPTLSLTGGAELQYAGIGRLTAGEIHLYLDEAPPDAEGPVGRVRLRPDRMVALAERPAPADGSDTAAARRGLGRTGAPGVGGTRRGSVEAPREPVRLQAPQLTATLDEWRVWFVEQPVDPGSQGSPHHALKAPTGMEQSARPSQGERGRLSAGSHPAVASVLPPMGRAAGTFIARHFEIDAHSLETRVVVRDGDSEVSDLIVQGNVALTETRTADPHELPMAITGTSVHVEHANRPHTTLRVAGTPDRPAHFEGRGLGLTAQRSAIHVDRGANRLFIDGPGHMDVLLDRDLAGRPLANPSPIRIDWQRRFEFDGSRADFEGGVAVTGPHQSLQAETLALVFARTIRFADPSTQPEPQIERIECSGGVFMENRSVDKQGAPSSLDRMQLIELSVNLLTGEASGRGPGSTTTVRRGSSGLLPTGLADTTSGARAKSHSPPRGPDEADDSRLTCLNVGFQGWLSGNFRDRELTFRDKVETVYGRVDSWQSTLEVDKADGPRPGELLLDCDWLKVAEMPAPAESRKAVEFEAEGNVRVEGLSRTGRIYTARAPRMTYTEAKELLILEGDGRTDAELYLQDYEGGPVSELPAHRILYWVSSGEFKVDRPRSLKLNHVPGGP